MHAWQFSEFGPLFNLRLSELPDSRAGSNDRDNEESGVLWAAGRREAASHRARDYVHRGIYGL
jgi:hypothetical protein